MSQLENRINSGYKSLGLSCSIGLYATMGVKFSDMKNSRANNSSVNNSFEFLSGLKGGIHFTDMFS